MEHHLDPVRGITPERCGVQAASTPWVTIGIEGLNLGVLKSLRQTIPDHANSSIADSKVLDHRDYPLGAGMHAWSSSQMKRSKLTRLGIDPGFER
jgi:hypothetical protein